MKIFYLILICGLGSIYAASLTKAGEGTCVLSGDSSATLPDPFVLSAGTLEVSEGANLGSNTGSLTIGTATLHITGSSFSTARTITLTGDALIHIDSGTATLSGILSGAGSLTKNNTAATLSLTNANTYTNGTTVQGGTLSLGAADALPSGKNLTLNNSASVSLNNYDQTVGTLTSASSSTAIDLGTASLTIGGGSFSGIISNTGQIIKTGTDTLVLGGANTYSGGTTISGGTLQGNTTSLQGDITNQATLIFNQTSDGIFSDVIDGTTGTLKKQGTGKLTFSGIAVQGNALIEEGSFHLTEEGILFSPTITVAAGASFSGKGVAGFSGGTFFNEGTVAPGASIGTLFIEGDYLQKTGSTLVIEVSPSEADKLDVMGHITIEPGATLALFPSPGAYPPLTHYAILQSGTGLTGTFDTVTSSLPAFNGTLTYHATGVLLLINTVPFSDLIVEGNAAKVAHCIDKANAPEGSDLAEVKELLQFMTVSQMIDTLNQMNSSLYNAVDLSQQQTWIGVRSSLSTHLLQLHRKKYPLSENRRLWGDFFHLFSSQSSPTYETRGFSNKVFSGLIGMDTSFSEEGFIGFFLGQTADHLAWNHKTAASVLRSSTVGLYLGKKFDYLYTQGAIASFYTTYAGKRKIYFPPTLLGEKIRIAEHKGNGWGAFSYLEAGLILGEKKLQLHPFVRSDYSFLYRSPFQETGANSINLRVQKHYANFFRSEAGIDIAAYIQPSSTSFWLPYGKLSWVWERPLSGKDSEASLEGTCCLMKVVGLHPTQNLFSYKVGLDLCKSKRAVMGISTEGELSRKYQKYVLEFQGKLGF